jgi:hypothetical protein
MRCFLLACLLAQSVPASAQSPAPTGPITLAQAVELGRLRGVQTALARSGERVAEARAGQRRADLLPTIGEVSPMSGRPSIWTSSASRNSAGSPIRSISSGSSFAPASR